MKKNPIYVMFAKKPKLDSVIANFDAELENLITDAAYTRIADTYRP